MAVASAGPYVNLHLDHYLVMMRIKIKLKTRDNAKSREKQPAYNEIKLKDKEVHSRYNIELQNRFEALEWATDIEDEWELSLIHISEPTRPY